MKTSWAFVVVTAIMLALGAIPANAQANRTWVSGTGTDSGTCTIAAPCASFQYALSQTKAGGEIDCLTPGDFGGSSHSLTIGQSVSIVCDGVSNGGILVSSMGNAISVDAPSGAVVYLSGLDLTQSEGVIAGGVYVNSGSTVYIVHSTFRGFGTASAVAVNHPARVVIKDSIIVNSYTGVFVDENGAAISVNTVIDGNSNIAPSASGTDSAVALIRTLLTGSSTGLNLENGASGVLIGPSNTVTGVISGTTTSVPFK
jgi:hypothetical protein